MCLWDAQFSSHVVSAPRVIALTTSWVRVLESNPLRVGLTINGDTANASFWWPDERSGTTGNGIFVSTTLEAPIELTLAEHGDLPSKAWFARISVAGASVFVIEHFIPAWLYNLIKDDKALEYKVWPDSVPRNPARTR